MEYFVQSGLAGFNWQIQYQHRPFEARFGTNSRNYVNNLHFRESSINLMISVQASTHTHWQLQKPAHEC